MTSTIYLDGYQTIPSDDPACMDDALDCARAHADRIVRALGMYCSTDWQRRDYAGLDPEEQDGPSEDGGEGGPNPSAEHYPHYLGRRVMVLCREGWRAGAYLGGGRVMLDADARPIVGRSTYSHIASEVSR